MPQPILTHASAKPLPAEQLRLKNAYWRAANYLSVGQIYLYNNPLLREPLTLAHIKPLVVGHWGTTPGQNFIYVHLNRVIKKYGLDLSESGIIPGIKVDTGTTPLAGHPGEKVAEGLDGLRRRLTEYAHMGAWFAKWRAVFRIARGRPTAGCVNANVHALARYATLCQEAGLVPVVEPELVMAGDHRSEECEETTERILRNLFVELNSQGVMLEGMLLKPNRILPGSDAYQNMSVEEVAELTLRCLLRTVPATVPGIAFLSGGQPAELASARLNAMNIPHPGAPLPWAVSFSFGRAIQQPALEIWKGDPSDVVAAQHAVAYRAACNAAARQSSYNAATERTAA